VSKVKKQKYFLLTPKIEVLEVPGAKRGPISSIRESHGCEKAPRLGRKAGSFDLGARSFDLGARSFDLGARSFDLRARSFDLEATSFDL
jgi:hypothetical protein